MSTEGLIASILILIAGLAVLVLPFVRRTAVTAADAAHAELTARYERTLAALRDVDEDHRLGKLTAEAYADERERLAAEGVRLLAALEPSGGAVSRRAKTAKPAGKSAAPADADAMLDAAIEQAIASYVKAKSTGAGS